MFKLLPARSRATLAAASMSAAILFATPAVAAQSVTPANDPCSAGYVQGALACQGYYGGNLFQGDAGQATPGDIQAIINLLLNGTASTSDSTPTNNTSAYKPPYVLDTSKVLATFDEPGQTINFGTMMNGLTVFGAHFGNNTDGDNSNVSAFWLVNLAAPTNSITLLNNGSVTTKGTSGAQLFATSISAPVPEPGTWALMLLGFGGIGVAMRRRRSKPLLQMA